MRPVQPVDRAGSAASRLRMMHQVTASLSSRDGVATSGREI